MTMLMSQSLANLAPALALAQGELEDAQKSSTNPAFRSKYADLAEVLSTARPVLSKHGLSIVQTLGHYDPATKLLAVTTMLLHKSGEYIQDTLDMRITKDDAQGLGSGATYARRYGGAAIIGMAQVDDDGNSAVARGGAKAQEDEPKAKAKGKAAAEPDADMVSGMLIELAAMTSEEQIQAFAPRFGKLAASDQTKVLPAVKAARARVAAAA